MIIHVFVRLPTCILKSSYCNSNSVFFGVTVDNYSFLFFTGKRGT